MRQGLLIKSFVIITHDKKLRNMTIWEDVNQQKLLYIAGGIANLYYIFRKLVDTIFAKLIKHSYALQANNSILMYKSQRKSCICVQENTGQTICNSSINKNKMLEGMPFDKKKNR